MSKSLSRFRALSGVYALCAAAMVVFLPAANGIVMAETSQSSQTSTIAGMSPAEAIRLGEQMYRTGILPSGEPMEAVVSGDIPVDGRMFACVSCHQRSGIGSLEGKVLTTPISGPKLYAPLTNLDASPDPRPNKKAVRPAYTDSGLANVIRTGQNPDGKQINAIMPVYFLNDRDMDILIYYLKNLSATSPPGVTETDVRFATVVTDEVPLAERESMLKSLRAVVSRWNGLRPMKVRPGFRQRPKTEEAMVRSYRSISLVVWELKGPAESWRTQLEAHYAKEPAFALIGGITTGEWTPIHRFCEDNRIPALFPLTDFPVISEDDWYTLYISKGFYREGETAARFLDRRDDVSKDITVVQIHHDDRVGHALARGFQEEWVALGRKAPEQVVLAPGETAGKDFWKKIADQYPRGAILCWTDPGDLQHLAAIATKRKGNAPVILSSRLLGTRIFTLPDKARGSVYFTHPVTLPQDAGPARAAVESWLKRNAIQKANIEIASQVYSLEEVLSISLNMMMMRSIFSRDYFLEIMDMLMDMDEKRNKTTYPVISFGQGQRYASKGCYIVQLTNGPKPELVKRSDWVIH